MNVQRAMFQPAWPLVLQALLLVSLAGARPAHAQEDPYVLTIENHHFSPAEIEVAAGKKVTLTVRNRDTTPEEFESADLRREKVVAGGEEITLFIGPLRPGRYEFFGDFNPQTARGHVVARQVP
jgi:hypothetical protein